MILSGPRGQEARQYKAEKGSILSEPLVILSTDKYVAGIYTLHQALVLADCINYRLTTVANEFKAQLTPAPTHALVPAPSDPSPDLSPL